MVVLLLVRHGTKDLHNVSIVEYLLLQETPCKLGTNVRSVFIMTPVTVLGNVLMTGIVYQKGYLLKVG